VSLAQRRALLTVALAALRIAGRELIGSFAAVQLVCPAEV